MTRPQNLKTKIFLDSGDPNETREIIKLLGFLDGQTTNPTLIAKNPDAQKRLATGDKFTKEEIYDFYRGVVKEISTLVPAGSVSVEVYADKNISADEMFTQGKKMFSWIPNAHIKYPTIAAGLDAAQRSVAARMRVNMTLVFSQEQATAVYAATRGAKKGDVFVSPFVGRLDDRGENGMDMIKNILRMYKSGDGHVEVLTASVRSMDHFLYAILLGSDIITAPYKILKEWGEKGLPLLGSDFVYSAKALKDVAYEKIDLLQNWKEYNIVHELTDKGIERFANDWNALIKK
ncbi:MAG: transaldolase [Candidatus Magasanikbacteria bacterium CG10_big_fil_rev_8_21_14_0_10_40_10]|uniref:Transaldolase n=1 Tax=Candidatus Magasanikbacteria bacterium CG10_big_fil_rev_8_21_14_0_10_40_10 TaxID=1974648 RepID=A0A2M6W3D6_9BACT|nr:MAG: transaldolase [Candidatus Magasanikbacteria bacterium CG10_big_fil_rev_8_21_14_0_10_40_10]